MRQSFVFLNVLVLNLYVSGSENRNKSTCFTLTFFWMKWWKFRKANSQ